MNLKTPYEQLITEKLEQQLPVPDMADAIWARIELELDALPAQEPDAAPNSESILAKAAKSKWLTIAVGGIITLVVLFILLKRNAKKQERRKEPAPTQKQVPANSQTPPPDTVSSTERLPQLLQPGTVSNDSASLTTALPPVLRADSFASIPLPVGRTDSSLVSIVPLAAGLDSARTQPPPPAKKPRGVPNISDKDYRISAGKKDSL